MEETDYRNLTTWNYQEEGWSHEDTVTDVEEDLPKKGPLADRPTDAPEGRLYRATDARILYQYDPTNGLADGDGWVAIAGLGSDRDGEPVPGTTYLEALITASDLDVGGDLTERGAPVATEGYVDNLSAVNGDFDVGGALTEQTQRVATRNYVDEQTSASEDPTRIDVTDYGDPADADPLIEDAATAANPGDTLVFPAATYVFTASHVFTKSLRLEFSDGAEIDDQRSPSTVGEPLVEFQGPGTQHTEALDAAAARGDHTVTATGTGWASAGDTLLIYDSTGAEVVTQFVVVDSITEDSTAVTTDLTLEGGVLRDFAAGADVYRVDLLEGPEVVGATVHNSHQDTQLFTFRDCYRPRVEDLLHTQIGRHSVMFSRCFNPICNDSEARNAVATGSGEGEPFYVLRSTNSVLRNLSTKGTRRGIDLATGCTEAHIENPQVYDVLKGGISAHNGAAVSDVSIEGGTVAATAAHDTACLAFTGESARVHVEGTRLVSTERCIHVAGPATLTDVTVELAPDAGNDPELITVPDAGAEVKIEGRVDIPTYTQYVKVAGLNGARDVDLDLEVNIDGYAAGGSENTLIQAGSGARNISIKGSVDSLPDLGSAAVRLFGGSATVENVYLDVDILNHGGQGVVYRGDAGVRNVRLKNATIDSDDLCVNVYGYDNMNTCEEFWFRDCRMNNANGSEIYVNQPADTVFIVDTVGSTNIDSNATNVYERP